MKGADPKGKSGGGFWPLQATYPQWSTDKRPALYAYRLIRRLDGTDQLGHFVYAEESVGDVLGGQLWRRDSREIPMWRFATPVRIDGGDSVGRTITNSAGGAPETGAALGPVMGGESGVALLDPETSRASGGGNGTAEDGSRQDVATGGKTDACAVYAGPIYMRSLYDRSYGPDTRLSVLRAEWNPHWPKFPKGFYGISLTGNKEASQEDLFFPCDPRLMAVNRAGDATMGSLVCDMQPGFEIDATRQARLQSMMWIIKAPRSARNDANWQAGNAAAGFFGERNSIAWNIGASGCRDIYGGLVIDDATKAGGLDVAASQRGTAVEQPDPYGTENRPKVLGAVSSLHGGFIDVGSPKDKHRVAADADGHTINSAHLSLASLFRRDDVVDGPLHWDGFWEQPNVIDGPRRPRVHFEFDPVAPSGNTLFPGGSGEYKWHSFCEAYTPTGDGGGGGG